MVYFVRNNIILVMKKYSGLLLIILSVLLVNSCTIYKKSAVSTRENLRNRQDIRIYAIYTVYGDTIAVDHDSKIITRISDYDIKFIDRSGNVQSIPMNEISGYLIREVNRPATTALKVTGIVVVVAASALVIGGIIYAMLVGLSA